MQASEVFERMFEDGGFVFRPFETLGLNTLRLSPNAMNTLREVDRFFDALEELLG